MSAAPTEYVYSPPSGRMNHMMGQPKYNYPTTTTTTTTINTNGLGGGAVVVRTPLDASILEQQMRMFMKEKRGGVSPATTEDSRKSGSKPWTAQASSHSYFSFGPNGAPAEAPITSSKPMNVIRPSKKVTAAPAPTGPNRNTILPTDVPAPPKMSERPAMPKLSASYGSPAVGLKRSPVVGRGSSIRAGAVARKTSPLMQEGIASPGRPRSNTDVSAAPVHQMPSNDGFRPRVPEKDMHIVSMPRTPVDHTRSRSLSPPPVAAAPKSAKKEEKRRNVFGLFPSSETKNQIATIFHRKPAATETTIQVVSRTMTPPPNSQPQQQWASPPASYYSRTASPAPSLTHSRDSSRDSSRDASRDNSTSSSRSHSRTPSTLNTQIWQEGETQIDIDEAIEKVWGPLGRSGGQAGRALHRAVDASTSEDRDRSTMRSRARAPRKTGLGRQLTNDYPNPSPLLPPVNREVYAKRTLPPAPAPAPVPVPVVAPVPASPEPEVPLLLPVAYCPDDDEEEEEEQTEEETSQSMGRTQSEINPLSPAIEPLQAISMQPMSPAFKRFTRKLSVFIPQTGRRLTEAYSAPGTPAEEHEMRYFLELPEGLGDFHLDSAIAAAEADEDDILVWLDSLNFDKQQQAEKLAARDDESDDESEDEMAQHAKFVAAVAAAAAAAAPPTPELVIEAAPAASTVSLRVSPPASPSLIARKPVASPQSSPKINRNLLSPPAPISAANSPPSPSNYSSDSAFGGRASFASSIGDAFKYDSYRDTVNSGDWRNAVISEYSSDDDFPSVSGLRLRGVSTSGPSSSTSDSPPLLSSSPNPSSQGSSPQTNPPSTTFSSSSPHFGSYYMAELDGNPIGPSKQKQETFDVYIDGTQSSGLLTAEIEAILAAQARDDEESLKQREREMDRAYFEKMEEKNRRTRYVRGRNSEFEGDILFVLRSEDMI
ncbi:hypothetical protein DFH27DRAFT_302434 [Peziza echinospora]|nr:hypothetical protein DFH27DRAFT_302434 [Peziza echinospora]